jgi:hypothetical protein
MFRVLHVFLVIRHGRRDVVRCSVITSPTAAWVAEQLRDHVIVLYERRLRQLIESFFTCNPDRTHLGVGKDSPSGRPVEQRPGVTSNLVSLPRVDGMHHRHAWRQAA